MDTKPNHDSSLQISALSCQAGGLAEIITQVLHAHREAEVQDTRLASPRSAHLSLAVENLKISSCRAALHSCTGSALNN